MKPLVADRVTSVIVVPGGIPAPLIGWPTSKAPAVVASEVRAVEPAVSVPVPVP